jgi:hypothetical protein
MADRIRQSMMMVMLTTIAAGLLVSLATPAAVAQDVDASTLLAEAAAAMAEVQSFRFEITTPRGATTFGENFTLLGVVGEVQRPDRFRAVATVDAMVAQLDLTMIGIGTTIWLSDPMAAEPAFMELDLADMDMGVGPSPATLLNPDRLLLTAVEAVEDPVIAGQDEIDGVLTTRVNGVATLDPLRASGMAGTPIAGMPMLGEPVQVAIWIDQELRVRQLDVYGPLLDTEAPNTVRRLKLTGFDEPIDIQPPTPTPE